MNYKAIFLHKLWKGYNKILITKKNKKLLSIQHHIR